jgi:hypothetical protein
MDVTRCKPGSQEARKPGSQEARKPGSQEARKPGGSQRSETRDHSQVLPLFISRLLFIYYVTSYTRGYIFVLY